MPIDFLQKWDATKKQYEALTRSKKPRLKLLGLVRTGFTGLSGALKKCTEGLGRLETAAQKGDAAQGKKALAETRSAHAAFVKAKENYVKEIDKGVKSEAGLDAGEKSAQQRGLEFLKEELRALALEVEREAGQQEELLKAGTDLQAVARADLANWSKAVAASLARAAAEVAKVRAEPTVEVYNKRVCQAARNLFYEAGQARQLPKVAGDPNKLAKDVEEYDTGQYGKLKAGTPPDVVLQHVAGFEKVVKAVAQMVAVTKHYRG